MDLQTSAEWVQGQKQLALSELEAARRVNDHNAIEAASDRIIHLGKLAAALGVKVPAEVDGKLGPKMWLLLAGAACAIVALLLSIHPPAGLISMEASSRGVRLEFAEAVKLKEEQLAFVGYDITEVSGAAAVVEVRSGATLPLAVTKERLAIEAAAAIAEINVAKDNELSVEFFGSDVMRLSVRGYGSNIDLSLNGTSLRLLDGDGKAIQTGAVTTKGNVRLQSASMLEVLLTKRAKEPAQSQPVIQYNGSIDLIAFDKRASINGLLVGRDNLLQSATVAFMDFGNDKISSFGGQPLSAIKASGAFKLNVKDAVLNAAFHGNVQDVRSAQSTLTPSFLHWLWKNTAITFTAGAIISVFGFLLASRTRIREFLHKE